MTRCGSEEHTNGPGLLEERESPLHAHPVEPAPGSPVTSSMAESEARIQALETANAALQARLAEQARLHAEELQHLRRRMDRVWRLTEQVRASLFRTETRVPPRSHDPRRGSSGAVEAANEECAMIPRLESSTLLAMILSARSLAKEGRLAEGYTHLANGLRHAEDLVRCGAPWGSRLTAHYRKTINHYLTRYGIRWS
jgi:hypothetical protein